MRRLGRRLVGTAMLGLGVLLIRELDFCGVVGGLVCLVVGFAAWEASFK